MRKSWNRLLLFCVLSMVQGSHVIHSTRVYNQEALHQFFLFGWRLRGGYSVCIYSDRRLSGAALLPPSVGFNVLNVMGTHAPSPMPLADHSSLFVFVVNILDNLLVRIKVFVSFDTSSHYSAMARRMYICISGYIFKGEWVKILLMQYSAAVFGLRVYGVDLYFD